MKIRFGLVLALAMIFGATGCASAGGGGGSGGPAVTSGGMTGERPRETDNTRAAERALEAGDDAEDPAEQRMHYQQARDHAQAAIAEDGRNPLAHRLAALSYMSLEEYQEAGRHFDHAAELSPLYDLEDEGLRERKWIDLYQMGAPLVNSGDYEGAVQAFENANAIYSGRPEALVTLAQLHAQLRNHDEALSAMEEATAFMETERAMTVDSATAADWQDQMSIFPELRANVLADAGRFEEAAQAYRRLAMDNPSNLDYLRTLAQVLMQVGREADALEVYTDIVSRPGAGGDDYYAAGIGFYQASDYQRAARAFGGAAGVSEKDRDALEMWARSMQLDSMYTEIPPVAERWLELDPNSQNGYLILAQAANVNGDQATTQRAIQGVEGLTVTVDQLQLQRFGAGGGLVSGAVINKTLEQGAEVTLRFTFYAESGDPIGSVTETVSVSATDMSQIFQIQFDSAEYVGGYGYELTTG